MDFLIHWPPGPVLATVQCQGLQYKDVSFAEAAVVGERGVQAATGPGLDAGGDDEG